MGGAEQSIFDHFVKLLEEVGKKLGGREMDHDRVESEIYSVSNNEFEGLSVLGDGEIERLVDLQANALEIGGFGEILFA